MTEKELTEAAKVFLTDWFMTEDVFPLTEEVIEEPLTPYTNVQPKGRRY